MIIRRYEANKDYQNFLSLIKFEGEEWEDYLDPKHQTALENSITYVAYQEHSLCGYCRSITDAGLYLWVIDLLVDKAHRGRSIGKQLLERNNLDFPNRDVYVLSDVDPYYEKLGYHKEGSVFKVG